MRKFFWALLTAIFLFDVNVLALSLHYVGETSIKTGTKFNDTIIGGLSGMMWSAGSLWAVSDDKGHDGEPRFYEFEVKIDINKNGLKAGSNNVTLTPKAVYFITGIPGNLEKKGGLDPEGLVHLPNGDLLISSEGNNNSKPRAMPGILRTTSRGLWKANLPVPDKFLPEATGQQKKGIQDNGAFEGLTSYADGRFLYVGTEMPLVQDYGSISDGKGNWVRFIKYDEKNAQQGYKVVAEYAYPVDALSESPRGIEIMRGVSEILAVSENKLIVLERGARFSAKKLITEALTLYLVDLSKGSDVSSLNSLKGAKFTGLTKTKLLDFETDLAKECGDKCIENFEALSWGPKLADGRRSLLVMSDNNFSKKQITRFLVFAVEGE
ncbi:MAG: esterase-like activity of phytase family protein [Pseudobdellovibrionaceae bacterium]